MVENMKAKAKANKTIVVRFSKDGTHEFDIDADVFDDPYLEAATRACEKIRNNKGAIIRAITECWEKDKPKNSAIYNSYWILVNAACYEKAEALREKFKAQTDCDLAKEPKCGIKPVKRKQ